MQTRVARPTEQRAEPRAERPERNDRSERGSERGEQRSEQRRETREPREHREPREARELSDQPNIQHTQEEIVPRWTPEMEQHAREWLVTVFTQLGRPEAIQSTEINQFILRVVLDVPFFDDPDKERKLLASLALLLLETCKRKFRINLRGHKVVITHQRPA